MATLSVAQSGYAETGTGYVTATPGLGAAQLKAAFQYDLTGRQITQIEYTGDGTGYAGSGYGYFYNVPPSSIANYRYSYYDNAGRVTRTLDIARQGSDTIQTDTTNQYGANQYGVTTAGYALGAVLSSVASTFKNDVFQQSATTTTVYDWYDSAVQKTVTYQANAGQPVFTTTYTDSGTGVLRSAHVADGRPRDVTVTSDVFGQAIRRDEVDQGSGGDPHELWYRFDGRQIGYVGNNGTLNGDYTGSIAQRTAAVPSGAPAAFRGGATAGSPAADFDQAYDAINSYAQGSGGGGTAGSYSVRSGDTLAGIATQLWGDASLWYKLAQANGLSGDSGLTAGTTLAIPGGVSRSGNSAATFRPYDPGDAYGDTSPTTPKPQAAKKGNNCGVFGQILLVAIAVAVTIVTSGAAAAALSPSIGSVGAGISALAAGQAGLGVTIAAGAIGGAAGSIASQGFGVATGLQDKFSWKGVALAGISGGIGGGLGSAGFLNGANGALGAVQDAGRGALGNALGQGVGIATGLQSRFDFAGVAVGGVVGTVVGATSLPGVGGRLVSGAAGALAGAATRSVLDGSDFGDNVLAALPDVIGATIGERAARAVAASGRSASGVGRSSAMSPGEQALVAEAERSANAPVGMASGWMAGAVAGDAAAADSAGQADIVVIANRDTADLLKNMTSYQYGRYTSEMGDLSYYPTALWASRLTPPLYYGQNWSNGQSISSYTPSLWNDVQTEFRTETAPGYQLRDSAYQDIGSGNYLTGSLKYVGSLGSRTLATAGIPLNLITSSVRGRGFQPAPVDRQDAIILGLGLSVITGGMGGLRTAEGAPEVLQVGGAYKDVKGLAGYEAHHIPADSISPLTTREGPSIAMTIDDHKLTLSYGNSRAAQAYRQTQAELIEQGDFRGAQQLDINDITGKFDNKYDDAIQQMLRYSQNKGPKR